VLVLDDSNDPELEAWCNCQRRWWRREYPGETDAFESSEHGTFWYAEMSTERKSSAGQNELAPAESRNLASLSRTEHHIQSNGNPGTAVDGCEGASIEPSVSEGRQHDTCKQIPILKYLSQRRKSLLDKLGFVWHVDSATQWDVMFQAVSS
jgi:hypothetical protein